MVKLEPEWTSMAAMHSCAGFCDDEMSCYKAQEIWAGGLLMRRPGGRQ